mmetsp:Transcript_17101/g.12148  ORF Transcript_17101/g.12148 Transcript_17101/m.12148 type:complete len:153 (-) Transcript_17101:567-1025(-)
MFSDSNDYLTYIMVALLAGFAKEKPRLLYYFVLGSGSIYLKSWLKIAYHQPRPFWLDTDIIPLHCKTSYGCPSGHTTVATAITFTLALDLTETLVKSSNLTNGVKIFIILNAYTQAVLYSLCVAYSRIVQGVHSYNQVVFGFTLGLWFALTL